MISPTDDLAAGHASRAALREAAARPVLLTTAGREVTGAELGEATARLAGALAERGLAGRPIGLYYRNSIAAFEAFLAVEWLGGTRIPVDPDVPAGEARAVFEAAGAFVVLTDTEHTLTGTEHGNELAEPMVHDDDARLAGDAWTDEPTVAPDTPLVVYPRQVAGGELFGVSTSYANWAAIMDINCQLFRDGWYGTPWGTATGTESGTDECLLTMQQLMHGTGMVASFPFLLMGLPQVVLPRFDAVAALAAIQRFGITATFAVPGMLSRLAGALGEPADRLPATGLSADRPPTDHLPLRHTLYGGAPLPLDELRRVARTLGPSLVQLYGRFEAGWPLAVLGPDEHRMIVDGDDELGSACGRPVPQVQVRLGEAPDRPAGYGELQTRNPMVSPDYAEPDGWCALGDVAHLDERGYLHLAGRLDGMINTGSYHVYPQQVEEAISGDAGVSAVRVQGEPDPIWGQAVTAYIVAAADTDWDALVQRLREALPAKLARYKIPKAFHRRDRLP